MRVEFNETFDLPVEEVYGYFKTPADWTRLYGSFGKVSDRGDGWYAVPLKGFPFPLVAKMVVDEPGEHVGWVFRGFWCGKGDLRFISQPTGVMVAGFEEISVRGLGFLSPVVEKTLLEPRFQAIWAAGWHRLRKIERQRQ